MKIAAVHTHEGLSTLAEPAAAGRQDIFSTLLEAGTEPEVRPTGMDDARPILPDGIAALIPIPVQPPLASTPPEPAAESAASGFDDLPDRLAAWERPMLSPGIGLAKADPVANPPHGPMRLTPAQDPAQDQAQAPAQAQAQDPGAPLPPPSDPVLPGTLPQPKPGSASAPHADQLVRLVAAIVPQAQERASFHAPAGGSPHLAALQPAADRGAVAILASPGAGHQPLRLRGSEPGAGLAARAPAAPGAAAESAPPSDKPLALTRGEDGPSRFSLVVAAGPEGQFGPDWSNPPGPEEGGLPEAPAAMSDRQANELGQGATAQEEGVLIQDVALAVTAADALDIRLTVRSEEVARDMSGETGRLVADLASVGAKVDSVRVETPRALGTDAGADAAGGQRPGAGERRDAWRQEDVAVAVRSGGSGSQGGLPVARPGDGGKVDRYA